MSESTNTPSPPEPASALAPTRLLAPLVPEPSPHSSSGPIWVMTFTDLIALLITFFVMLFAMSQVEQRKWQNLTDSLATDVDAVREIALALPSKELDMETVETLPGRDLDYLATLLRQQMAEDEALTGALIQRLEDRLIISLPGDLLFSPDQPTLVETGDQAVRALGALIRNVTNRIEVTGYADPSPPGAGYASNWELSLDRAMQVADLLGQAGYRGDIVARGFGDSRFAQLSSALRVGQRLALARRVDIVVHDDVGERGR